MDPQNITKLIASLNGLRSNDLDGNAAARTRIIDAAYKAIHRLQVPSDRIMEIAFQHPVIIGTLQTFHDIGLWQAWAADDGGEKSLNELVKLAAVNVDINLLRRLCRLLTSVDILDEVAEDQYKATEVSLSLGRGETLNHIQLQAWIDHYGPMGVGLPTFLKKISYREPLDPTDTCYRDSNPEKLDFWSRLSLHPALQESFGGSMEGWTRSKNPWPEFFDTAKLFEGADLSRPIIVDVGGNVGKDLERFLLRHPDIPPGSLVLQDRPQALELAKASNKIKTMVYDFFTPQPVTGSRAYFFHAVFHDWEDRKALDILKNLVPAMKRGYSRLLICDVVLPLVGATPSQAAMDVQIMAILSSRERTETTWRKLLSDAGFRIIKLWPDQRGYETLIEAELA
ncbi:putative O-methyltransferase [Thozetella sp. PMI_491]|nr:putative O-methyltransferase [Thozetella sp. PMI_491]